MLNYKIAALSFLVLITSLGCSESDTFPQGEWIDLTHDFSSETIYWPTAQAFKSETVWEGLTDKGFFYLTKNYSASEHGGTHIDAPIHFAEGKETVDEIPLSKLIGVAVVVDVSKKASENPDYQIGIEDFRQWEDENGRIPDDSIVLLNTGYSKYWPDKAKYLGTEARGEGAVKDLHFPGLDPEAAKWLIENRSLKAIGLDTASIDYGQSQLFKSHITLFEGSVPAFENVANLDKLPAKGAIVIALPTKIKGGSGGPLRIVALVPHDT